MNAQSELHRISIQLDALQSRIEALIAAQLGFERGPRMTLEQEVDVQDAACEAIEQWSVALLDDAALAATTPLQHLLDQYVSLHDIYLDALEAAGIRP